MLQQPVHLSVKAFIEKCTILEVPRFQRDYAWGEEEIKDFIDDWKDLARAFSSQSSSDGHFLGGLVTVEERRNGSIAYRIVDGQQRLTTIFLAIWRLKHAFQQILEGAKIADQKNIIEQAYQAVRTHDECLFAQTLDPEFKLEKYQRLVLSQKDRIFFEELITDRSPVPDKDNAAHGRLRSAAEQIQRDIVDEILDSPISLHDKFMNLAHYSHMLFQACYVLHLSSDNQNEAYRLFSILNNRGKSLSDGDHLRWSTMELIDSNGAAAQIMDDVADRWDYVLSHEPAEIAKFLEAYYPSYTGRRAKKNSVADDYRREFFNRPLPLSLSDTKKIGDRVSDIGKHMEVYRQLVDGSWPWDPPTAPLWTQSRLQRLTRDLKHTLCIPLLLAAQDNLSEDDFAKMVLGLEKFVFRYITVVGAKPSTLYPKYYEHAKKIRDAPTAYEVDSLLEDLRMLAKQNAADDAFRQALEGDILSYAPPRQLRVIRYFLTTLNDYCQWTNNGPQVSSQLNQLAVIDPGQVNVEHIYPQNAKPTEVNYDLEPLKHDIGNLTFWAPGENKKVGNKKYQDKRQDYIDSKAEMTRSIGNSHKSWTRAKLRRRRIQLIDVALKIFNT